MRHVKHWQDYGNIVLGLWLLCSPIVLGFSGNFAEATDTVLVGALLLAAALGAVFVPRVWEDWVEVALGAWLLFSPLFIEFRSQSAAANAIVVGLLVVTMALWALEDEDLAHGVGPHIPL